MTVHHPLLTGGLPKEQLDNLCQEIVCLWELGASHVNIIRIYELLRTNEHVVLATQCASPSSRWPTHCNCRDPRSPSVGSVQPSHAPHPAGVRA